jgi:DNA-binding SARP family transcriptional activator
MARLTLSLLGGFQARLGAGSPLVLPAKAQALLAYLATRCGQAQPRDKLGPLLWGGTNDEQARSNLRHTLFTIRKAASAASPPPLITEGQTVVLAPDAVDIDVQLFEALVREATPEAMERAATLYQGELLDGLGIDEPPFEEWLLAERERLREMALDTLAQLLAHESRAGMTQRAIHTATRLLVLDPLQEVVHRSLMRLYARQGRRAAALKQYQTCTELLARELGTEPESQTLQLYLELKERRDTATPAEHYGRSAAPRPALSAARAGGLESVAERKRVTVLFADLGGSIDSVLDRDPEEARRLLDPLLERMMGSVRRYGGTVNAVLGNGITALFGAPRAQEDHAVRACYAALDLKDTIMRCATEVRRAHGLDLAVRLALNSGEVIVRSVEGDLQADYGAVAQATRLAASIQHVASPGTIRLTGDTGRLVEGCVELKSLGRLAVNGGRESVEMFEIAGTISARSRLHPACHRGLTRFIGREAELAQLARAAEATRTGRGRVVAVVGEPGVGKSRLLHELAHAERPRGWRILETGGVAYGSMMSYLPVIALLKSYLAVEERDTPREVADKLRRAVLAVDAALEPTLPALAALLDAPVDAREWSLLDPTQRRRRTLDGVRHLLVRASQERPLLLLCEDLQWIDGETQAFLDGLVESLPTVPLLVVVTYRPEYEHPWGSKSQYAQLRLEPLPPPETSALLEALLGEHESLRSLKPMLTARAGGTPLFLEESVRALVETGALEGERGAYHLAKDLATLRVPATVQAVLAARIDRLSAEGRRLLQTAAVIGRDVPFALLQAVVELPDEELRQGLAHLQDAELLYETRLFPNPEYAFRHALTHEVAYGSFLEETRRTLHARIVEAIEQLHAGRLTEQVERLAHHAVRGELWEKAVRYLRPAGLKAAGRSALQDARGWFEQALGVLDALPESPATLQQAFEIRLELRTVLNLLGEVGRVLERLREAEILAEKLNDDRGRGQVCAFLTNTYSLLGELDEALASGTRALEIAGRLGDVRLRILSTTYLEQEHYLRGEHEGVVQLATDNLAALPADWVYEYFGNAAPASVYDRYWLVMSLTQLGRFTEAAEYAAEALRLAESTHHPYTVGQTHFGAGTLHLLKGEWAKARSVIEHGIAVIRSGNVVLLLPLAVTSFAWVLAQLGDASEALNRLREGERLVERLAARGIISQNSRLYHALGRAALLLGRLDEARRLGDRAVESSSSHPGFAAHALHLLGDIATHPDRLDVERGEAHYREALALAEPRGMRPLVAHCHLGLGRLYRRTGMHQQAREHLTPATTMYREMDMRFWLQKTEQEMRELS